MERNTHQKQIIIDYLKGVTSHPTAEDVFQAVKKKLPTISRSTVYRILKDYSQKEELFELFNETNRYDANLAPHAHFICQKCYKVFDVFNHDDVIQVKSKSKVRYMSGSDVNKGNIENFRVYLYGICDGCK